MSAHQHTWGVPQICPPDKTQRRCLLCPAWEWRRTDNGMLWISEMIDKGLNAVERAAWGGAGALIDSPPGGWILVSGSRDWPEDQLGTVTRVMIEHHNEHPDAGILTGGAMGVDAYAENEAHRLHWFVDTLRPEYARYGRKLAPKMRNIAMLERPPVLVLAFHWDRSPGTGHTIREAYKRGIPFVRIHPGSLEAERQLALIEIDATS